MYISMRVQKKRPTGHHSEHKHPSFFKKKSPIGQSLLFHSIVLKKKVPPGKRVSMFQRHLVS